MSLPAPIGSVVGDTFVLAQDWAGDVPGLGMLTLRAGWSGQSSIPRWAWSLLGVTPLSGTVLLAGLIHDWLYASRAVPRAAADDTYWLVAILSGCPRLSADAQYRALRLAGWYAWHTMPAARRAEAERLGDLATI